MDNNHHSSARNLKAILCPDYEFMYTALDDNLEAYVRAPAQPAPASALHELVEEFDSAAEKLMAFAHSLYCPESGITPQDLISIGAHLCPGTYKAGNLSTENLYDLLTTWSDFLIAYERMPSKKTKWEAVRALSDYIDSYLYAIHDMKQRSRD